MSTHITTGVLPSPWSGYTSSTSSTYITTASTSNLIVSNASINSYDWESLATMFGLFVDKQLFKPQRGWKVETEDGTIIDIDNAGNISVCDKDAKIIYKANRIREFNRYLNASDLLEEFIRFAGRQGVRQGEVLQIPIEVFINWLVVEASKADGEEPPAVPLEDKLRREYQRCLCCGRFISKQMSEIAKFCSPQHYERYVLSKQKALAI